MLHNIKLFFLSLFFYFFCAYFFGLYLIKNNGRSFLYSKQWLLLASVFGGLFLVIRYRESSYLPLVSLFEITFFYAWMMGLLYIILVRQELGRFIHGLFLLIIYTILIWDIFLDKNIYVLNPVLKSFWLGIHVPSAILSYSAFTFSFVVSLYYIFTSRLNQSQSNLDIFNFRLIVSGVMLLAVCIVSGAIWAKSAWGRFWSNDPKEIWALFTFIIYAMIILTRKILKLNPRLQATLSIIGFLAVLFTFFGINLLFSSHHAY